MLKASDLTLKLGGSAESAQTSKMNPFVERVPKLWINIQLVGDGNFLFTNKSKETKLSAVMVVPVVEEVVPWAWLSRVLGGAA